MAYAAFAAIIGVNLLLYCRGHFQSHHYWPVMLVAFSLWATFIFTSA